MDNSPDYYDIDESFPMLLATCVKYMREALNANFKEHGFHVSNEQWSILVILAQQDGISQQDLADRYERSKVSAFNLIKKLESRGLVVRYPDPVDGRCNRVFLTAEGRKLQRTLIPIAKANIKRMSEGIEQEDIELMKSIVRKISQNTRR